MGEILFLDGGKGFPVRVGQIQVVAQHRDVEIIPGTQLPQPSGVAGGQGGGRAGNILQGFAQGKVDAGEAFVTDKGEQLLNGQLFAVVQAQSQLNHVRTSSSGRRRIR